MHLLVVVANLNKKNGVILLTRGDVYIDKMPINIQIEVNGDKIYDSFNHENSTLSENAVALRRLEEIKRDLIDIDYDNDLFIQEDLEWHTPIP